MSDQVLDSLQIDNSADGGATTVTYQSEILEGGLDMPDEAETVDVAEGFAVRRGFRKAPTVDILDPGAFTTLVPAMEGRFDTTLTYTWKGGLTTVLNGAKILVQPIMDTVPDNVKVYYDTDTTVTDNPDTDSDGSWTELSEVLGETGHDSENHTRPNGRGLPYWVTSTLIHDIPLFYDSTAYSNIKTEEDNRNEVRIAIENQAGNYRIYGEGGGNGGVHVEIHQNPSPQFDEVNHMILRVYQTGSFDNIISYPSSPDDYFMGVSLEAMAFGHDEGDILTENR